MASSPKLIRVEVSIALAIGILIKSFILLMVQLRDVNLAVSKMNTWKKS